MQRKTVVINRDIYSMIKDLKATDRYIIWDLILENLFDGKTPEISEDSDYSDSVKSSFILLRYELNKLQKQFENGKKSVQKKSTQNFTQSFCPLEDTQVNPTEAKSTQLNPHTSEDIKYSYNINNTNKNNNNKIINNNIYNINNNKQTNEIKENKYINKDLCEFELTQENRDLAELWRNILQEKINIVANSAYAGSEINNTAIEVTNKFTELAKRVAESVRPLKVQGYYLAPELILEKYVDLFRCKESVAVERLNEIYLDFEEKTTTNKITNSFKYLVAYFYNKACEY